MASMYDVKEDSFSEVTEEMNKEAVHAINSTWSQIGGDYLELCDGSIDRDEMLEAVLDADRLVSFGNPVEVGQYIIWMKHFRPTEWKAFCKKNLYPKYGF